MCAGRGRPGDAFAMRRGSDGAGGMPMWKASRYECRPVVEQVRPQICDARAESDLARGICRFFDDPAYFSFGLQ